MQKQCLITHFFLKVNHFVPGVLWFLYFICSWFQKSRWRRTNVLDGSQLAYLAKWTDVCAPIRRQQNAAPSHFKLSLFYVHQILPLSHRLISFSSIKQVTPLASFSSDFRMPLAERAHLLFLWGKIVHGITTTLSHINLHGLFNAKVILVEQQHWYYLTHSWCGSIRWLLPKGISLKGEHNSATAFWTCHDFAVQHVSHYPSGTVPSSSSSPPMECPHCSWCYLTVEIIMHVAHLAGGI